MKKKSAILYIVSTPIGNLEDITIRAINVLKLVDLVLCEDTRRTKVLLDHYQINTRMKSYHIFNEHLIVNRLVSEILDGKSMALVSDSGTPCISDPGYLITSQAVKHNIDIVSVPGPSAFLALLSVSAIPISRFHFIGFLPKKKSKKISYLAQTLNLYKQPIIFYESPYRILKSMQVILSNFGDIYVIIGREMTKSFEETYRGYISDWLSLDKKIKGEYTVILYNFDTL